MTTIQSGSLFTTAHSNISTISVKLNPHEKAEFSTGFLKDVAVDFVGNGLGSHGLARAANQYLWNQLLKSLPTDGHCLLLSATLAELWDMIQARPNLMIYPIFTTGYFRDGERISDLKLKILDYVRMATPGSYASNMFQDIHNQVNILRNPAFQTIYACMDANFSFLNPVHYDFMVARDCLYDLSKHQLHDLFVRHSCSMLYSIHHYCAELKHVESVYIPPLRLSFDLVKHTFKRDQILMTFNDDSAGYVHDYKNFMKLSTSLISHRGHWHIQLDKVEASYGYGFFKLTPEAWLGPGLRNDFMALERRFVPTLSVAACMEGQTRLMLIDQAKKRSFVLWLISQTNYDLVKIVTFYRSSLRKLTLSKIVLEQELEKMDEDDYEIIANCVFQASLEAKKLRQLQAFIVQEVTRGYAPGLFRRTGRRIMTFLTQFLNFFNMEFLDYLTKIENFGIARYQIEYDLSRLLRADILVNNLILDFPLLANWYYNFAFGDGYGGIKTFNFVADKFFKYTKKGLDDLNASTDKARLLALDPTDTVHLLGVEPGGMYKYLQGVGIPTVAYLYKAGVKTKPVFAPTERNIGTKTLLHRIADIDELHQHFAGFKTVNHHTLISDIYLDRADFEDSFECEFENYKILARTVRLLRQYNFKKFLIKINCFFALDPDCEDDKLFFWDKKCKKIDFFRHFESLVLNYKISFSRPRTHNPLSPEVFVSGTLRKLPLPAMMYSMVCSEPETQLTKLMTESFLNWRNFTSLYSEMISDTTSEVQKFKLEPIGIIVHMVKLDAIPTNILELYDEHAVVVADTKVDVKSTFSEFLKTQVPKYEDFFKLTNKKLRFYWNDTFGDSLNIHAFKPAKRFVDQGVKYPGHITVTVTLLSCPIPADAKSVTTDKSDDEDSASVVSEGESSSAEEEPENEHPDEESVELEETPSEASHSTDGEPTQHPFGIILPLEITRMLVLVTGTGKIEDIRHEVRSAFGPKCTECSEDLEITQDESQFTTFRTGKAETKDVQFNIYIHADFGATKGMEIEWTAAAKIYFMPGTDRSVDCVTALVKGSDVSDVTRELATAINYALRTQSKMAAQLAEYFDENSDEEDDDDPKASKPLPKAPLKKEGTLPAPSAPSVTPPPGDKSESSDHCDDIVVQQSYAASKPAQIISHEGIKTEVGEDVAPYFQVVAAKNYKDKVPFKVESDKCTQLWEPQPPHKHLAAFIEKNPHYYHVSIPPWGDCVWRSIAVLVYGMIEGITQVRADLAKYLTANPNAVGFPRPDQLNVPHSAAKKLFKFFKVPFFTMEIVNGELKTTHHREKRVNHGAAVLMNFKDYLHCDVILSRKMPPHEYIAEPVPLPIPKGRFKQHLFPPSIPNNQSARRKYHIETMSQLAILQSSNITPGAKVNPGIPAAISGLRYQRSDVEMAFVNGCAGSGKSTYVVDLLVDCVYRSWKGDRAWQDKYAYVCPTNLLRQQVDDEITALIRARDPSFEGMASDYVLINTWYTIFVNVVNPKKGDRRPNANNVTMLFMDEATKFHNYFIYGYAQLFPKASLICVGDKDQIGYSEKYNQNTKVKGIKEVLYPLLDFNADYYISSTVTRRFGPLTCKFLEKLIGKKYRAATALPNEITIKQDPSFMLRVKDGVKTVDFVNLALEDQTLETIPEVAVTINSAQGITADNAQVNVSKHTLNTMLTYPANAVVGFTRHRYMLNLKSVKGAPIPMAVLQAFNATYEFKDIRPPEGVPAPEPSYGGVQVDGHVGTATNFVNEKKEGYWNMKITPDPKPFAKAELDYDIAKEIATLGALGPDRPLFQKYSKLKKYPRTATWNQYDHNLVMELSGIPLNASNTAEAATFVAPAPDERIIVRMRLNNAKLKAYMRERMSFSEWAHGKIQYVADEQMLRETVFHRMANHVKAKQNVARYLSAINFDAVSGRMVRSFLEKYVDMEKYNALLNKDATDEAFMQAWAEYTNKVKMTVSDTVLTYSQILNRLKIHLKQQVKAKDFESGNKNKEGQPIFAAEKMVNLIFSVQVRFAKIVLTTCLKDNIKMTSGMTQQETEEFIGQFKKATSKIWEGDFVSFDSARTMWQKMVYLAITKLFALFGGDWLDLLMLFQNNMEAYATSFMAFFQEMLPSGHPDTWFQNTVVNMMTIAMVVSVIVWAVFSGDDSSVGLGPDNTFDFTFVNMFFPDPMKFAVYEDVTEFCNTWFSLDGASTYALPKLVAKIYGNKDFTQVIRTPETYAEYQEGIRAMLDGYLRNPQKVVECCKLRMRMSTPCIEILFQQIDAFNQLPYHVFVKLPFVNYPVYGGATLDVSFNQTGKSNSTITNTDSTSTDTQMSHAQNKSHKHKASHNSGKTDKVKTIESVAAATAAKTASDLAPNRPKQNKGRERKGPGPNRRGNKKNPNKGRPIATIGGPRLGVVKSISDMIVDPEASRPVRVSMKGTKATALAKVAMMPKLQFASGTGNIPENHSMIFIHRDALRPLIIYDETSGDFEYTALARFPNGNQDTTPFSETPAPRLLQVEQFPQITWGVPTGSHARKPHGDFFFPATDEEEKIQAFYLAKDDQLNITNLVGTTGYKVNLYQWSGDNFELIGPTNVASGLTVDVKNVLSNAQSGYFAVSFTPLTTPVDPTTKVAIKVFGSNPTWGHISSNDFSHGLNVIGDNRVNSIAVRVNNETNNYSLQGAMVANQFSDELSWEDVAAEDDPFNFVGSSSGAMPPHSCAKGLFAWLKPTDISQWEFKKQIVRGKPGVVACNFRLDAPGDFIAAVFRVADKSQQVFTVNCFLDVEFLTTNRLFLTAISDVSEDETKMALEACRLLAQYTENPSHLKKFSDWISKAVGWVAKNGSKILEAGKLVAAVAV